MESIPLARPVAVLQRLASLRKIIKMSESTSILTTTNPSACSCPSLAISQANGTAAIDSVRCLPPGDSEIRERRNADKTRFGLPRLLHRPLAAWKDFKQWRRERKQHTSAVSGCYCVEMGFEEPTRNQTGGQSS